MTLRTIVVIEDDPMLRQDTTDMLEAAGLSVVGFGDGDQALDYLRDHRENVAGVFTDVRRATETDGFEVACLVTEAFPEVGAIVTSGHYVVRPPGLSEDVRFLPKPWLALDVINAFIDLPTCDDPGVA
ncbi:MAG: response regulator, partial [Janthinobacterium lividum]